MITSTVPYLRHASTALETCSRCGASGDSTPVYGFKQHVPLCLDCLMAAQDELPAGLPCLDPEMCNLQLDSWITGRLMEIGLSDRETKAELNRVHPKLLAAIRQTVPGTLVQLLSGARPKEGFGLVGVSGIGKSQAVAALLRCLLTNAWRRAVPGMRLGFPWTGWTSVRWLNWPDLALRWRLDPLGYSEAMETELRRCSAVPVLVLDDIGLESLKDEETDRVTSVLLGIIAARDRVDLPVIWLSNLKDRAELVAVYNAAFVRRLIRVNPIVDTTSIPLFR